MADETTNALANLGIPTLERTRTVEILGEQLRQLSLVYEGGDASRVGKLLGAATLVTGRLIVAADKRKVTTLSIRLLDVRTGSILTSLQIELFSPKLDMTTVSTFPKGVRPHARASAGAHAFSTTTNSIGMTFVVIPAGEFIMGSPPSEAGREPGETEHSVTITMPFEIGMYEVTQAQYEYVTGKKPSRHKGANNPVDAVSWNDATEFCRLLSALPAEHVAGRHYRLPTETEWEYACRAGSTSAYCFGNNGNQLGEYARYGNKFGNTTEPVGQRRANAWGLHDMHGNVWEWCADWVGKYPATPVNDPGGPESGDGRVLRGGCYIYPASVTRSAYRTGTGPTAISLNHGFRVITTPIQQ